MVVHSPRKGTDDRPMSSKIITTVVGVLLLAPFAYLGYHDAVSIEQHLHEQHQQIRHLTVESAKLDTELTKTQAVKIQSQTEVNQLDKQTKDAILERQKLEAELGAN